MPGTVAKQEIRAKAIALLAEGKSQKDAALSVGVSAKTVQRWVNEDAGFAAELQEEISRRKRRLLDGITQAKDDVIDAEIANFKSELEEYRKSLAAANKALIDRGKAMVQKGFRRLQDLPDESLSARDATTLISEGRKLVLEGHELWADELAVAELVDKLDG